MKRNQFKAAAIGFLSLLALGSGLVPHANTTRAAAQGTTQCRYPRFELTVHRGPSAGLELTGQLLITINASGGVDGTFTTEDRTQVSVTGQATGKAINLVFDLGDGLRIFGAGAATKDIRQCEGVVGGPLVGPRSGDDGDWLGSTFGTGDTGFSPNCMVPKLTGPYFQNGKLFMNAAASCAQIPGAQLRVRVPLSTTQFLLPLNFDVSGAYLVAANASTAMPAGSCRILNVVNPNAAESSAVTFCR